MRPAGEAVPVSPAMRPSADAAWSGAMRPASSAPRTVFSEPLRDGSVTLTVVGDVGMDSSPSKQTQSAVNAPAEASSGLVAWMLRHRAGIACPPYRTERLTFNSSRSNGGAPRTLIASLIAGAMLLPTLVSAQHQTGKDKLACEHRFGATLDQQISGCTAFINAGQLPPRVLASVFVNRATAYIAKHDYDRAIDDTEQAIKIDPTSASAFHNRGRAYSAKGEHGQALRDFNKAIELDPHDPMVFTNRGVAFARERAFDRAIQDYDQALRLAPADAAALNNRGEAYLGKGQPERAIQDFNQAIHLDSRLAAAFYNRGVAHMRTHQNGRAIADFDEAIRLRPNYDLAVVYRAFAYRRSGERERAIADLRKVLAFDLDMATRTQIETALRELGVEP
jgi:tetratricopeptide (TPR) repeat protein